MRKEVILITVRVFMVSNRLINVNKLPAGFGYFQWDFPATRVRIGCLLCSVLINQTSANNMPGFLKLLLCRCLYVCVCVCVCPKTINN